MHDIHIKIRLPDSPIFKDSESLKIMLIAIIFLILWIFEVTKNSIMSMYIFYLAVLTGQMGTD